MERVAVGIFELPEGYRLTRTIELSKGMLCVVLALGFAIAIGLIFLGDLFYPLDIDWGERVSLSGMPVGRLLAMVVMIALYFILHELVHGLFFKRYSGKKARYSFKRLTPAAGSDAYYTKRQYIAILLAPVVLLGLALLALNLLLPGDLFWVVYLLQVVNLSAAAGDFYVTATMARMKGDILARDTGHSVEVCSAG